MDPSTAVREPLADAIRQAAAPTERRRSVLILGSTGSVGTQALDVIAGNPDAFTVAGLAAGGADPATVAAQAVRFRAPLVALGRADADAALRADLLAAIAAQRTAQDVAGYRDPTVLVGPAAVGELIDMAGADIVLNAVDGSRGLEPTLRALATGASLALANKESLVAGGPLVLRAAAPGQIVPVDSEHSALAQCLRGGRANEVAKLVITASGGPFRGRTRAEMADVTVSSALAHPTWSMGPVVTLNSATMVNKALEVIEAHLLFGVPYDRIDVVVHPQSIVHSMVTFTDGATLAQASPPTMLLPIALALAWPHRLTDVAPPCAWDTASAWTFEPLDEQTFPAVRLARAAGAAGGCLPAVFNAANEEGVAAFLTGGTGFLTIVDTIDRVLSEADEWRREPGSVAEVLAAERWARDRARTHLAVAAGTTTWQGRD
ncbi:MAG TPA: 1-deoxy-D-xylulose-5-phosphate reductoisomerase [Pseudonocardiaceae bacterium]|jgi:1-deoxy-D-xylulose-5-phosphate reductoisomerase|nr:1-deoxy-D-xylulose-5-phosphate reductoisomerase [Pseudonocardiaceae bacterium]